MNKTPIPFITVLPVGSLTTNCYLVADEKAGEAVIIDPGDDADFIAETLIQRALRPMAIIATHGHFDHILAVGELQALLGISFYIHPEDLFLVKRMRETGEFFLKRKITEIPPLKVQDLAKKREITVGSVQLEVIETPGHTPGSIALYEKNYGWLFSGDTLFADGAVGRTDFKYADPQLLDVSLHKLFDLPGSVRVLPGHGRESTIQAEKLQHALKGF